MKIKKLISFVFLSLFSFSLCLTYKIEKVDANYDSSEIVMEVNTNRILYQKDIYSKRYMASTTKILTAIVIIENCNLKEEVTIDENCVNIEGSSLYLEVGEKLSVKDLLYGLMLRSGNDCAVALALHCSGSLKDFSTLMNDTAKKIGANNSNFVTPHGLHDDNHYTTAYDLALISCYAIKNDIFKEIVSTKSARLPFTTRNCERIIKNKNKMLFNYEGATGIKTGYTKKAGRCLVSSCDKNGLQLVSVVLNCPPMFERSAELFNTYYKEYGNYTVLDSSEIIKLIPIKNKEITCAVHIKKDIILPLSMEEYSNLQIVYELPDILDENTKNDEIIGAVKILYQNNLLFEEKIYTIL